MVDLIKTWNADVLRFFEVEGCNGPAMWQMGENLARLTSGGLPVTEFEIYTRGSFPEHVSGLLRGGGSFDFDGVPGALELYRENGGYPAILTCLYQGVSSARTCYFWIDGPLQAAEPARLKARSRPCSSSERSAMNARRPKLRRTLPWPLASRTFERVLTESRTSG